MATTCGLADYFWAIWHDCCWGGISTITLIPSGTNGGLLSASISVCGTTSNTATFNIPYNPNSDLPPGGSIIGDNVSCRGQVKTFTAPFYENANYQWIYDGQVVGSNSHILTFSPYIAGLSTLEVRISKGTGCLPKILRKNLWRGTPPAVSAFTWYDTAAPGSGGGTSVQPSKVSIRPFGFTYINLIAVAPYSVEGTVQGYEWEHNGVVIEGNGSNNVISIDAEGLGYVRVRSNNICGQSEWFTWYYEAVVCPNYPTPCTGNGSAPTIGRILVYPNPAEEFLNVSNPKEQNLEIILYNRQGKIVLREVVLPKSETKLNTDKLSEGLYYLHIKQGKDWYKQTIQIKR